jgi:1-acyl-sn-glycerol-3-phosphate acyltransferase
MVMVMSSVSAHAGAGGCLCIFPEGKVNRSPDTVLPFRNGSFAVAAECDMAVVTLTSSGTAVSWPRAAAVGGLPATLRIRFSDVAPRGHGLDVVALREKAYAAMQADVDALVALRQ